MEGPCRYLGHLIGHEGEGSLYYILKKLGGYCTSIAYFIISFLRNVTSFEMILVNKYPDFRILHSLQSSITSDVKMGVNINKGGRT